MASISAPWGDTLRDNDLTQRGYRFVWARDLYHTAMGLLTLGDRKAARQILDYMLDHMERDNGSVPQNQFVNGNVHWTGTQLDEVADPLILAWQLGATDAYAKLKPLADFVATRGPSTQQERWEENGGYSPATLAAEIAGLVCAADLANRSGDPGSAQSWLATADNWNANIERWTFTTQGTLSSNYYLRITQNGDPNTAATLTIQNGGGNHDQRDIVDPSFLELVRLGVRVPNDANITRTLPVIDSAVRVKTPKGAAFYRYPFDGYGEQKPGDPYNGKGHAWPLLAGERGIYEVLAGHPDQAKVYLNAMRAFANPGGMIPEQVYETTGEATGSAAPLVWAHAEYVILTNAIASGVVSDRPRVVYVRYGTLALVWF